jgi:hypothetical protein
VAKIAEPSSVGSFNRTIVFFAEQQIESLLRNYLHSLFQFLKHVRWGTIVIGEGY